MKRRHAFTLIELSIVLVIIGLIVGGVLVGKDLIEAAKIRSQVSQIEKYQTAANTFRLKYNCIPGDCKDAANFGLPARGTWPGQGDGDGKIIGNRGCSSCTAGHRQGGETVMFWVDLSASGLIDTNFSLATSSAAPGGVGSISGDALDNYLPRAKIGNGNHLFVFTSTVTTAAFPYDDGISYYGLSKIESIENPTSSNYGQLYGQGASTAQASYAGISTIQALRLDEKVDDGLPMSGRVIAIIINPNAVYWLNANVTNSGNAYAGSSSTCYDNGNSAGAQHQYSTAYGNNVNCALAFKFQ